MTITVTMYMIAIICAISLYAENQPQVKGKLLLNPYRVFRLKEFHRLLTSGFVHGGMMHLLVNMVTMYFFGYVVEATLGGVQFVALFILGVIISDIPTLLKYKDAPHYNSLGASGGIAAVLFCSVIFYPTQELYLYFAIPIPGYVFALAYLAYSYYQSKNARDNINHDAHMYGALFGIAYAFIAAPDIASKFLSTIIESF